MLQRSFDTDQELLARLQEGDESVFSSLYDRYWSPLYAYVYNRIRLIEESEELVQEVFIIFWENHSALTVTDSLAPYLFSVLKKRLLSYFRSEKVRSQYAEHFSHFLSQQVDNSTDEEWAAEDLKQRIEYAISELPNKCQQVFWMSRRQQLSIEEIARELQISNRTVENYLTTALKHLRSVLGDSILLLAIGMLFCR
ncbi:RNA polymerase sigma-70 factor [Siphonobacter sp. SORGH_AS_0500]|uniref:RNA polymerase sigma factor n=1 Tax=Siphonobacter sp. SORGH_AS_0500 TaxID=1864824 RepID=UPI00286B60F2|nr:RNA polymerase sigma-70 factor [Siphonobacter sp. SORGH_AS_0500]